MDYVYETRHREVKLSSVLSVNPLSCWKMHTWNIHFWLPRLSPYFVSMEPMSLLRVFSGDILIAQRSCLTPQNVDQPIFLMKNLTMPSK